MKLFTSKQIKQAIAYAEAGGQALHLWNPPEYIRRRAPIAFRGQGPWAHLLDMDEHRLVRTVKRLGVKVIKVERRGTSRQHIDLCAGPLARALMMAERVEGDDGSAQSA